MNLIVLMALALAFAVGCSSPEGEKKNFEATVARFDKYAGEFPGFKKALDAQKAKAKKVMGEAAKISDPDKKAAKMAEANKLLEKLDDEFDDYLDARTSMRSKSSRLSTMKVSNIQRNLRNSTATRAKDELKKIEKAMASAAPKTPEEAYETVRDHRRNLERELKHVEKMIKNMSPKKKQKK